LKAVGPPGDDEAYNRPVTRPFADEFVKTHFTERQRDRSVIGDISEGDVFVAYWTGLKKLIYLAECQGGLQQESEDEIRRGETDGRRRWCLYWAGRNLTPQYGSEWFKHNINPWRIARQDFPSDYQTMLRLIRAGREGIAPVSYELAKCLIERIASLSVPQPA
jgi:hypothetical protein